MLVRTTRFGDLSVPEHTVITFEEGIPGFPHDRRYVLIEHDDVGGPLQWLQSLDHADRAFVVVEPTFAEPHFAMTLDADTARALGTRDIGECALMALLDVSAEKPERMTANLKAPLVVNSANRRGRQVILGGAHLAMDAPVFQRLVTRLDERRRETPVVVEQRLAS